MLDLEDDSDVDDAVAPVVVDLKLAFDDGNRKALPQSDVAPRTDRCGRQRPRRAAAEDRGAEPSQVLVGDQACLPRRPRTPLRDPWGECGTSHDEFVLVGQRRRHVDGVAAEHVGRREQVLAVEPDVAECRRAHPVAGPMDPRIEDAGRWCGTTSHPHRCHASRRGPLAGVSQCGGRRAGHGHRHPLSGTPRARPVLRSCLDTLMRRTTPAGAWRQWSYRSAIKDMPRSQCCSISVNTSSMSTERPAT